MVVRRTFAGRLLVAATIVMIVAALAVSVALATHVDPVSLEASTSGCRVNYTAEWDNFSGSIEAYVVGYVAGKEVGTKYFDIATPPDFSTTSGTYWVGESEWDSIDFYINDAVVESLGRNCTMEEPQYWWFSVMGLPGTGPEASHPNTAGNTACALFDVQGWGAKTVDLSEYPDCEGDVSVMCLDGDGNWVDNNIHNFSQTGSLVTFMSSQHGTCGFFPAS